MMGGGYPSWALPLRPSTELPHPIARACPEQPRDPPVFTFLRTLLRVFALSRNSTLFFSSGSALFAQNTRGGGIIFRVRKTSSEGTAWARQAGYRQSPPAA